MEKKIVTADFVTRLADKGYTKKDSAVIIGDFLDVIYEAVSNGESVSLTGFGCFHLRRAKPKTIMNVNSGALDTVPSRNYIRFTPGLALKRIAESAEPVEIEE